MRLCFVHAFKYFYVYFFLSHSHNVEGMYYVLCMYMYLW